MCVFYSNSVDRILFQPILKSVSKSSSIHIFVDLPIFHVHSFIQNYYFIIFSLFSFYIYFIPLKYINKNRKNRRKNSQDFLHFSSFFVKMLFLFFTRKTQNCLRQKPFFSPFFAFYFITRILVNSQENFRLFFAFFQNLKKKSFTFSRKIRKSSKILRKFTCSYC